MKKKATLSKSKLLERLIKTEPIYYAYNCFGPGDYVCIYCSSTSEEEDGFFHTESCPWSQAKALSK